MEVLEHFSHGHPLTFCEEAKDHRGEEVVCSPPNKITCIFHRHHPLTLYEKNPYVLRVCDICDEQVLGFTYCCERCEVNFHLKCALEHRFEPKGHQHSFMLERQNLSSIFTCDLCDVSSTNRVSFLCTTCQLRVHKNCTYPYPLTVKQVGHAHQLRLTYSTEFEEFKGRLCRICYRRFNHHLCCYTCASCFYIAHLDCATSEDIRDEDEENQAYKARAAALMPVDSNNDQVTDLGLITQDVVELSLEESSTILPVLITHFSHKHCLRLITNEELTTSEQFCDGCTRPIFSSSIPFYSCVDDCDFFLHKSCAELPNKIQHTLHRHPLTLLTKVPWDDIDFVMFICDMCKRVSNGFTYTCEICKFSIDVWCSSFLDTLEHKCHPAHVLNLIPICYDDDDQGNNCNACHDLSSQARFVCEECKFNLDLGCASLPYEIEHDCPKHNWHARPLHLIYNFVVVVVEDDNCGKESEEEYYCDVCEERRGKNAWFYYCEDCDYAVHPGCTVANYMVKFGKCYDLPHHSHPLTFVKNNIIGSPPCATCGDPCRDLVLVCSECNFNIHAVEECYVLHD